MAHASTILGRIGRYELKAKLGQGTLGQVLLAEDSVLAREVAIKVLRPDLSLSADAKREITERLKREARAAAALAHPNVCELHDMGEDPQFGLYWVLEYVRGPSLRSLLDRDALPVDDLAKLARELGSALSYAHESGTLHRDLKPENVLISRFGTKVTDFGIGRLQGLQGLDQGTSRYTSPEALSRDVYTARNDQYSMAILLTEALLGKLPEGDLAELTASNATLNVDPQLATRLLALLARGRSIHAEDRFPTCRDLGDAVAIAIEQAKTGAPAPLRLSLSGSMPALPIEPAGSRESDLGAAPLAVAVPAKSHNVIVGLALVVLCALIVTRRGGTKTAEPQAATQASDAAAQRATAARTSALRPRALSVDAGRDAGIALEPESEPDGAAP
jgi:eukaryotic-like serine/threonine-protein kinase